jgi:cell division septation protein DedD
MRARSVLTVAGAAVATAAGAILLQRRVSGRKERVELFFEGGALVSLAQGEPGADRLLAHARELLTAARS